ncbi:MAG: hypothetical protein J7524_12705 [Roseofilum sp. Belize BBD 4]|uniref:hypothetical protein n=1 Tax=Roseofilum sp. Belize BBD 4 TaxID=2821500 RepID=UPI000E859B91|nr:hypothetical protein [Roseofilum sp. Belize BBD 4]MBP0034012.1 hypothetical protein [Roseofilum sp. Belize BBD 4]HBQ98458.1 hypothetical protein [Cyanobacteria bacterium UBA11691]
MNDLYDFATQKDAIAGCFSRDYELNLNWLPEYVDEFSTVMNRVTLKWQKCKFVSASEVMIPDNHGVYCFSTQLGYPFPEEIHIPLYIGKAAPGYLSERFQSYLTEKQMIKGRAKLVFMLNKYRNNLFFWWAELPRIYVDAVEEHLLMCCQPPCNEKIPSRQRLWAKAFD